MNETTLEYGKFKEKRVQCVKGSYYMYLPKKLCEKYDIDNSKIVYMKRFEDDSLLLKFETKSQVKSKAFVLNIDRTQEDIDNNKNVNLKYDYLLNQLLTAYIIGHSQIILRKKEKIPLIFRNKIHTMIKRLYGMVVISEKPNEIIVEEHLENMDIKIFCKQLLSKIHIVMTNFIDIVENYESDENNDELLNELIIQDDHIDEHRYTVEHLVHKTLNNPLKTQTSYVECLHYSEMTRFIERIGDYLVKMSKLLMIKKIENREYILEQLNVMLETYKTIQDFFDQNDSFKLWKFIQEIQDYAIKIKKIINEKHADTEYLVPIRRICNICSDIVEIRINNIISHKE
jgi:phosphate uptake regulator